MTKSPYVRSAMAQAAMLHLPPLLRKTLLEDPEFRREYGFSTDAVITFNDAGISIQRSELFDAARRILSGDSVIDVIDTEDRKWKLKNINAKGKRPRLVISKGKQLFNLPDFAAISPDSNVRVGSFNEAAFDVNLPLSAQNIWRDILTKRPLFDDELDVFHSDFRETPVHIARSIQSEIASGKSNISSLVLNSRRYFERLVGVYDGSKTIREYATGNAKQFFKHLSTWRRYDGFLYSLFLSSHSALTVEISVEGLADEELVRAFEYLEKSGDRLSQLGAVEIGLRILPERPEIETKTIRLIEQIRDDEIDKPVSGFKLLSALFCLVDGELSRIRLLSDVPPFYRRLASLSQAALIQRQFANSDVDIEHFCEWVFSNRGEEFYLQSLIDMRIEPHWNPDLAVASQMKADFFGRIMISAKNYEKNIKDSELLNVILGTKPESLQSLSDFYHPYLPGPIEGGEQTPRTLPAELVETIETQLGSEEVGPSSFIALVNSALFFRISANQAEFAAKALKLGSYRLVNIKDKSQLLSILNGLATVSAVVRSHTLANELRILVRRYRHDPQFTLSIVEVVRVVLVAAASRTELDEWKDFTGDWLTELAFGNLEADEGGVLYSVLQCLCHIAPELWISCGRADAALIAYNVS